MSCEVLSHLQELGYTDLSVQFADLMSRLSASDNEAVALAAALVVEETFNGSTCVDLNRFAGKGVSRDPDKKTEVRFPAVSDWCDTLRSSCVTGEEGDYTPLILDSRGRLYLYRYKEYESILARELLSRVSQGIVPSSLEESGLPLFEQILAPLTALQRIAVQRALRNQLCVISGGPGTGKTYTVARFLIYLWQQQSGSLNVLLSAPTGKAAMRLQESLLDAMDAGDTRIDMSGFQPEAYTIHRLLGYSVATGRFRFNRDTPLSCDVLVVDEVSMADLALLSSLLEAVPRAARVILLGDMDQLASVEAGAVLADICGRGRVQFTSGESHDGGDQKGVHSTDAPAEKQISPMSDSVVVLRESRRFTAESGIGHLSKLINSGDTDGAWSLLKSNDHPDLVKIESSRADLPATIFQLISGGLRDYIAAADPLSALAALRGSRILAAVREGPFGVSSLNRIVEDALAASGDISLSSKWYHRRPVMVTRNLHELGLFNGDVGIVWEEDGERLVHFAGLDGCSRSFAPTRLPQTETVFVMTVHKSQGSEFDEVVIVLPDRILPVVTRELLYTGITRARNRLVMVTGRDVLQAGIANVTQRSSGLLDILWPHPEYL